MQRNHQKRNAFTLVELLVVIAIIGLLMGFLVPVLGTVMRNAKTAAMKQEVDLLSQAIEEYRNRHGEYPPDFSDGALVMRHFRNAYPRIDINELTLLGNCFTHSTGSYDPSAIDRAEALVFALGGFSSDEEHPFTGEGGPFEYIGPATRTATEIISVLNYQYNPNRSNPLYDFGKGDLTVKAWDPSVSNSPSVSGPRNVTESIDESELLPGAASNDLFPVFRTSGRTAPYVYFDSRTYGYSSDAAAIGGTFLPAFNGYGTTTVGLVRPFKSTTPNPPPTGATSYGSVSAAANAWQFMNPDTFQVVSAGFDDTFGEKVNATVGGADAPVYFIYPTGQAMVADASAAGPLDTTTHNTVSNLKKFQEGNSINGIVDNITNFATGTLESDLE